MSEIKYPLIDRLSRIEKIKLADSLIGKQLWTTHWWVGKYWTELSRSQARNVQYVMLHKDGGILLAFKDGMVSLSAYGEVLFETQERADSELAYIRRRDKSEE